MADPAAAGVTIVTQQASQAALVSMLAGPLDNAWELLTPSEPSTMDRFITAITALIHHFGLASGTQAAKSYQADRKAAGIPGSYSARPAPTAAPDKIDASIRWATKDLWVPNPDIATAKTQVAGVVEKDILDVGRMTIINAAQHDRKAQGWARETEPGACSFCAMLAVRGAVYRSETSASFESHDHCRCFAAPVFTSHEPSAQVREWQALYQSSTKGVRGSKAMRAAFRKAFDAAYPPKAA